MLNCYLTPNLINITYYYTDISDYDRLLMITYSKKYFNLNKELHLYFDNLYSDMLLRVKNIIKNNKFLLSSIAKELTSIRKTYLNECIVLLIKYDIAYFTYTDMYSENDTARDCINIKVFHENKIKDVYISERIPDTLLIYHDNESTEYIKYNKTCFPLEQFVKIYMYRSRSR